MKIYAAHIKQRISDSKYQYFLKKICEKTQQKIDRFHFEDDKKRSLYGEILVRYFVGKIYSIPNHQIKINYDQNGKPYLDSFSGIHFNISHSGDWVMCAVDDVPIGIDIEQIQKIDTTIARHFFTPSEYRQIIVEESGVDFFYQLWTLKESYVKYKGLGLGIPFDSFEFDISGNSPVLYSDDVKPPFFISHMFKKNYYLALCSKRPIESLDVCEIIMQEIFL